MSKFFKMLPILAVGLIAALATVGCASTENQEPTETAVQRTAAVTYAAIDGSCEHDYEATQTFAATCTEQGYTVYTCANCGDSYTDNFVAAKGHTFQDIIVPATCTHKGYVTHFCTTCGYEYSDTFVDETGHTYTDEVTAPTCTEQGYTTHTCNTCGYSYKDSYVEALGHDYTETVTEPTCTDGGYTTYTCQTCGNDVVADYTEAKGHTYSETVHPATCVSYGYTEHICSDCGDRYVTDYQKATGHTYLDIVVEVTEDSIGYTRHLCIVCNYSYLSDFVTSGDDGYIEGEEPAHEHEYKLYVQDFETDKYFIALRVCVCGDSKVGNLNIQLSNADAKPCSLLRTNTDRWTMLTCTGIGSLRYSTRTVRSFPCLTCRQAKPPKNRRNPKTPTRAENLPSRKIPMTETANLKILMTENPKRRKILTTGMAEKRPKNRSSLRTKRAAALRQLFC